TGPKIHGVCQSSSSRLAHGICAAQGAEIEFRNNDRAEADFMERFSRQSLSDQEISAPQVLNAYVGIEQVTHSPSGARLRGGGSSPWGCRSKVSSVIDPNVCSK